MPAERSTRRSRNDNAKVSADKSTTKTNSRNNKEEKSGKTKTSPRQTVSKSSTRSKGQDQAKQTVAAKKLNIPTKSGAKAMKKTDTDSPSRSNRRTRTSSVHIEESTVNISSKKATPSTKSVTTPQTTTAQKSSTRKRLIASEPPTQKVKSGKVATKKPVASTSETASKSPKMRSSLSNVDDQKILDTAQHRTRRALAKEFMVNNVITRNRSVDGVKLLDKLPQMRRKSVGTSLAEKSSTTAKTTKPSKTPTALSSRRVKSIGKK